MIERLVRNTKSIHTNRHFLYTVAVVVFCLLLTAVVLSNLELVKRLSVLRDPLGTAAVSQEEVTISREIQEAVVYPTTLSIPKLNMRVAFEEPLGLNEDGTVEVPDSFETVGWYKYGPVPGELGPAVVLGHIDSKEGPAVFYDLGQLKVGDAVEIVLDDGGRKTFAVTDLKRYEQDDFPRELVYGDIDHAGLRLITCSGVYNRSSKRYSHNLVVYAALVE